MHSVVSERKQAIVLASIILVLIAVNIPRLQFNLFWCDECFSITSVQSFSKVIERALWDAGAHPPLYLFMLYAHCQIFGYSPVSYQLYAMIPWILIMIVGATFIRKRFGFASALIFILLSTFLKFSVRFEMEVRSYEWCALFVLICYIYLLKILEDRKARDYCIFTAFSILSAYSHYYCAMAIAFFYLVLIIDSLTHHKEEIKRVSIMSAITIVAYVPWIIIAFKSILYLSHSFWKKTYLTPLECMGLIFDSPIGLGFVLFLVMILFTVLIIMNNMKENDNKACTMDIWIIAGLLSIGGSIFIATIVSLAVTPILVDRYLYPVSIVAWLLLSYSVINYWKTNTGAMKKAATIMIAAILITGIPYFIINYSNEIHNENLTEETLNDLSEIEQMNNPLILSNIRDFDSDKGEIGYYFPSVPASVYDTNTLQQLKSDTQYYLFIEGMIDDETITVLNDNGYTYEMMSEKAQLDMYKFCAYRLIPL